MKIPNHTALKEWAAVVSAIASGDQLLLLRKGGIAEPSFDVEASSFYLLPTYLHQKEKQFKPEMLRHFTETDRGNVNPSELPIDGWCEVVRQWQISDLSQLERLAPFLIFTNATILERFRFRPDQAVHVVAVRGYRLPASVLVQSRDEYAGCRSWVSVEEEISIDGSTPAMEDADFEDALERVERSFL